MTYFNVVCRVRVHKIQDKPPKISSELIMLAPIMDFITYRGEVPISP
jgi:hypothetical protein